MSRCTICASPLVERVNTLIRTGTPIRAVARTTGLNRATLGRHARHLSTAGTRLALIRSDDGSAEPPGSPIDPLDEAFALCERASTPREKLRGLEAIRAATRLKLKGLADLDKEDRALLQRNIEDATVAYRASGDYETAIRALQGVREALAQLLESSPSEVAVEMPLRILLSTGEQIGEGRALVKPSEYWAGVPARFRDADRYVVEREIRLALGGAKGTEEVQLRDARTDVIVWANDP